MIAHAPTQPVRIPVTVLTGFLGAGKTTVLNHLRRAGGRRFAVLVNDFGVNFGSVNIDADLIVAIEGGQISLADGCVCCRIRGNLLNGVLQLAASPNPPEHIHILVGTSGVSNPWPVAETFVTGRVRRRFQLHSILTVVDAEQARRLTASVSRSIGERVRETFAMLRHGLQPLVCKGDDHAC